MRTKADLDGAPLELAGFPPREGCHTRAAKAGLVGIEQQLRLRLRRRAAAARRELGERRERRERGLLNSLSEGLILLVLPSQSWRHFLKPLLTLYGKHRLRQENKIMGSILYIIGAILVAMWLLGLVMHIGGGLIHIILVVAVIVFLFQFFTGRQAV